MDSCESCALRLFNPKGHNIIGEGCTLYGNIIIIPYIDKDAYRRQDIVFDNGVKIVQDVIMESCNENVLDWCYMTSLIKCKETQKCPINDDILRNCFTHLIKEFEEIKPKNVLLLGTDTPAKVNDLNFYNHSIKKPFIDVKGINFNWNFSPYVKYYNRDRFELFKSSLIKWFTEIR